MTIPLIANLDPERVEEDHRIDRFQRPALPFADLVENRVGDLADQIGGHLGAVELGQMALDLPYRHAPPVETDDLLVEAVEAGLALRDDHRFERAGAVARHLDLDLAVVRQQRFAACAVAAVARPAARRVALLIAKVVGQLAPSARSRSAFFSRLKSPSSPAKSSGLRLPPARSWSKISGEKSVAM
ncbi:hypothetical protein ABIA44_005005 [Bradyrhizobium sp. USDA 329]